MAPAGQNTFSSEPGAVQEVGYYALVLSLGTWAPAAGSLDSIGCLWAPGLWQGPSTLSVQGLWLWPLAWISWVAQTSRQPLS